ncbi:MAG: hypothetical protein ACRD92_01855 [Nitrosopumilaceae archaeon]
MAKTLQLIFMISILVLGIFSMGATVSADKGGVANEHAKKKSGNQSDDDDSSDDKKIKQEDKEKGKKENENKGKHKQSEHGKKNKKTTICHIPPGNPDNPRTISVSNKAVAKHLGHGDHVGRCNDSQSGGSSTPDPNIPSVTNVSSTNANGVYHAGNTIAVTVTFSEAVTVTGTPRLLLETGTTDRDANYASGSGTSTLTFNYVVQSGDLTPDLDYKAKNSLKLNGGKIRDSANNNAVLTLPVPGANHSLGSNKNIIIATIALIVTNVSSTNANGVYYAGNTIAVTVTFSEAVAVTGTPQLQLETGAIDRQANYVSGSGTNTLTLNYVVQPGDSTNDLDYLSTTSLTLNGGTIKDSATNTINVILTLPTPGTAGSLDANKNIVIDTTGPTVSSVSSTVINGAYGVGNTIAVTVTFSEAVTVTGTPQLQLETGSTDRVANYVSGSGTATLTFNYVVLAGDSTSDLDYLSTSSLTLNGGTIKDLLTNTHNAALTLPAPGTAGSLGANKNIVIDAIAPIVSSVSSTSANGSYNVGDTIAVTITFSEPVNVSGTPRLLLETGSTDRFAIYVSGSGTATLTFNYVVQIGDTTADLDYVSTTSLELNGGTISDPTNNNVVLTLPTPGTAGSLGANKNILI